MIEYEFCGGFWWIFPLVMMILCFVFMRGCSRRWMWRGRSRGWMWGEYSPGSGSGEAAINILKQRYAKGEIDRSEYEEKRKVLADDAEKAE